MDHKNGCGREPLPGARPDHCGRMDCNACQIYANRGEQDQEIIDALQSRKSNFMDVLAEIVGERAAQDVQWGGPGHDDKHTPSEWACILTEYVDRLPHDCPMDYRTSFIKIAAVAVAAVESHDRKTS